MKLCDQLLPSDLRLVQERLADFVPQQVFDIHAHLFHTRHFAEGKRPAFLPADTAFGVAAYKVALSAWLPGRNVEGLFFGYPSPGNDRLGANRWLAAELKARPNPGNRRALALVSPQDDPAETRRQIQELGLVGIKPYHVYAPVAETLEAAIEEFAPPWMWEICHEINGVLMLHIVRHNAIADPVNLGSLRKLCREFSRCQVVFAHVARSFNHRNALDGLKAVADLDNVWVDTSAITEAQAMQCALEVLGPRRVLFGSDYPVSELRGKCLSMGNGFTWLYAEDLGREGVTRFGEFTLVGIESLLCLREACENCGLIEADLRDIFRDNALRLLWPHLRPEARLPAPSGPELWSRARQKISCGTGLLSKRAEVFDPVAWPSYYSKCSGSHVWDLAGRRYLDFTGGVGAVLLGYADPDVNAAVKRRASLGSYCTLVSPEEVELAELLLDLHPWAQRVRYARGGGDALGVAVRIARAATGRSGIAFCGYHGWNDWYLAANLASSSALDGHLLPGLPPLGVPRELQGTAVPFKYNDLPAFRRALGQLEGRLAAVVMEPMRSELPRDGFLEQVAAACRAAGGVFVVDEVTSGWRFGFPGACAGLKLEPDIAVYAKAMSNGFPCAAIVGRAGVMDAANASFISSSYWTDGIGPAAALACLRKLRRLDVQPHVWKLGEALTQGLAGLAARHPLLKLKIAGMPCAPSLTFQLGDTSLQARAVYIRKMLARGFLVSGQFYVMWTHDLGQINALLTALDETFNEMNAMNNASALIAEGANQPAQGGFTRLA